MPRRSSASSTAGGSPAPAAANVHPMTNAAPAAAEKYEAVKSAADGRAEK